VLHDLIGERLNVDHVVIGERGVYMVETKTWRSETAGIRTSQHHRGHRARHSRESAEQEEAQRSSALREVPLRLRVEEYEAVPG